MYSVILSNRAIKDLTDIVEYIGADNPDAAEKTGFELVNLAMSLDYMPYRGSLADADQRSIWLERMDTVGRKLAPMNGSEPRRGFLLCLAAILESAREMKSTLQSSELTAGRAVAA
jgi:plasmid stabilization system protein ParE